MTYPSLAAKVVIVTSPWVGLFAQATDMGIAGTTGAAAGWLTAITSTGVLGWFLFVRLPANDRQMEVMLNKHAKALDDKDAQIKEMIKAKDVQMKEMIESRDSVSLKLAQIAADAEKERRADFRESLRVVVDGLAKEVRLQTGDVRDLKHAVQAASGEIGNQARQLAHQKMLQDDLEARKAGTS